MTYKMYIMTFQNAHFGSGTLDSSKLTFSADRIFSALVLEALKMGKLDAFLAEANQDDFTLTDAFPFQFGPFLPKPIGYPKHDQIDQSVDVKEVRRQAKLSKKLQFLALENVDDYLNGDLFENEEHAFIDTVTKNQPHKYGNLYQVATTRFSNDTSLYVIANESDLLNELMTSLQYSGLGGKRSSGYGRFELDIQNIPLELSDRLTKNHSDKVMSLTTALPVDADLEEAMEHGHYLLTKSSGFAFSHATNENYRKQDLYKFASGSTFSKTFEGQIVDVRPLDFPHAVLNYAKPLFYKLEV